MKTRLIIDGNAVYEIDEECEACFRGRSPMLEERKQKKQQKEWKEQKEEQKRQWHVSEPEIQEDSEQNG